jgi:hypothetical protein
MKLPTRPHSRKPPGDQQPHPVRGRGTTIRLDSASDRPTADRYDRGQPLNRKHDFGPKRMVVSQRSADGRRSGYRTPSNGPLHAIDPQAIITNAFGCTVPLRFSAKMMSSRPDRIRHGLTGAFILLIVGGSIAPSTAHASCGDYVTSMLSQSTDESYSRSGLMTLSTARVIELTRGGPKRHIPCAGPSCSSERPELPPPPAPSSLSRSEASCGATAMLRRPDLSGDDRATDPGAPHPLRATFFIERPPRSSHPHPIY